MHVCGWKRGSKRKGDKAGQVRVGGQITWGPERNLDFILNVMGNTGALKSLKEGDLIYILEKYFKLLNGDKC